MKKLVTLVLALVLVAAVACASATSIGVIQLVQHEALDLATQGFIDAVTAAIPDADIEVQKASGDTATCATIANTFVSANVDLIMANATAALQAAANVSAADTRIDRITFSMVVKGNVKLKI